ncbi:NAD-dependent epimerase/dehydratase family protein [Paraburkholderia caballeronis]|uniref:Nucleoside-diphosphate-sugar epimerase n=1 Tax=Paraburkholderia caballeronis TaxID=416943 RepID=A0A1H7JUB3_9BURK|nr:NAD-dependent epimerase/dehydratase family protein [Paraburkholderia caballeronis]PXW27274.1 nucleoside-diphosphate-sugar epimerase [Paraburkholderia caballeronis]PXX02748.1 nucleoside-diphosphate-sugar epimerase [Paraburkholderia caballeronis]RAK03473.1 nucleoside-diphosphate-sugar epimerase [Paraburkholderia caballeronis]SEC38735.1 Nucleoside-diphosphate-sugar epimerase [Paraburkholderia caballeronis]SEK77964.1 Nucleoside-diphosphate-sugar epimerase [Paraburkholderia caballeronis]
MESTGKVALFGATGATGARIAAALRAAGRPRRMIARSRAQLAAAFGDDPDAELVEWNPDDPASIVAAATGVDTAVYLVGVPYHRFELHPQLMRKTIDGLVAAGVRQLILIGTVYPYGRARTNPVTESHPREPHTFKGRMRLEQENLVLAAHGRSGLSTLVLRLPDFYGPGVERSLLNSLFNAAATGSRAQMLGPIDAPHEFVFLPDVGPVVETLTRTPNAFGRVLHLAGAGTITQREIASRAFALAGRTPKLMVAGKPMLRVLGLFNPLMRELVEMHYLLAEPLVLDDSKLRALIGPIHKTSYEEGIRQSFAAASAALALPREARRVPA